MQIQRGETEMVLLKIITALAEKISDFRFSREVYQERRDAGWNRVLKTTGK
jgi:hypothetical protein